jgi:L,D-peptidoglycan transpeptidase YkuD (ErfK/YbiS/YcfS/YnhG family)
MKCALGRAGLTINKREGDGATPVGDWIMRKVYYRADRVFRPSTSLPISTLKPCFGWCDAPQDNNYNRLVHYPYRSSAEALWRHDLLYDIVVVLSHNECPRIKYRGSAIFLHIAHQNYAPTAGCIAVSKSDLLKIISTAQKNQLICINA